MNLPVPGPHCRNRPVGKPRPIICCCYFCFTTQTSLYPARSAAAIASFLLPANSNRTRCSAVEWLSASITETVVIPVFRSFRAIRFASTGSGVARTCTTTIEAPVDDSATTGVVSAAGFWGGCDSARGSATTGASVGRTGAVATVAATVSFATLPPASDEARVPVSLLRTSMAAVCPSWGGGVVG